MTPTQRLPSSGNLSRRSFLNAAIVAGAADLPGNDLLPTGVTPTPSAIRRVGLDYSLWHQGKDWRGVWGKPLRGYYRSDDSDLIRAHAAEIVHAGVDFLILDATNDIGSDVRTDVGIPYQRFEEHVIATIFRVYASLVTRPKLVFMLGYVPDSDDLINGRLTAKADEIYDVYIKNPHYTFLFEMYLDRPLLIIYGETPARWQTNLPPWSHPGFTVRFMTAGLTEQPELLDRLRGHRGPVSRLGYWSWQDRGPPTYPVVDGHPEAMMITAFWPADAVAHSPGRGRMNGKTYVDQWERARRIGPRFLIAGTFNEFIVGEQPSAEMSKDVEPTVELGTRYIDILREQAKLFRSGR